MHHTTNQAEIEKLRELINDIDIAMMVEVDGTLRSRRWARRRRSPTATVVPDVVDTPKVDEIQRGRVNVSYAAGQEPLRRCRYGCWSTTRPRSTSSGIPSTRCSSSKADDPLAPAQGSRREGGVLTTGNLIATVIGRQGVGRQESELGENEKINLA
jgi:hypothetical protein